MLVAPILRQPQATDPGKTVFRLIPHTFNYVLQGPLLTIPPLLMSLSHASIFCRVSPRIPEVGFIPITWHIDSQSMDDEAHQILWSDDIEGTRKRALSRSQSKYATAESPNISSRAGFQSNGNLRR